MFATAAFLYFNTAVVHADPLPTYECPHSHAHVWDRDQCDDINPFGGIPGTGHGGGGQCGGLCGLLKGIGGLL